MKTDYCSYSPQIAADVEVTEQRDGERVGFVIGSTSAGRYILVRETEHRVLGLISETLTPEAVCAEFLRQHAQSARSRTSIVAGTRVQRLR